MFLLSFIIIRSVSCFFCCAIQKNMSINSSQQGKYWCYVCLTPNRNRSAVQELLESFLARYYDLDFRYCHERRIVQQMVELHTDKNIYDSLRKAAIKNLLLLLKSWSLAFKNLSLLRNQQVWCHVDWLQSFLWTWKEWLYRKVPK